MSIHYKLLYDLYKKEAAKSTGAVEYNDCIFSEE